MGLNSYLYYTGSVRPIGTHHNHPQSLRLWFSQELSGPVYTLNAAIFVDQQRVYRFYQLGPLMIERAHTKKADP